MRKLLSALAVPKLGTGEYWDPLIPGLALRVGARRRTWTLRHRVGGRHRRDILGYFPTLSLGDARTAAGKLLERVEAGAVSLPPPVHPRSALTLGALIDRYEALRQREGTPHQAARPQHAGAAGRSRRLPQTAGDTIQQG